MASEFLKALLKSKKHATAGASKLLATYGGKHIYNIKATADIDNGCIVKRGAFTAPDYYAEAAASAEFRGKVVEKASNGNWYVEVTATNGDCLVCSVPLVYTEGTHAESAESSFYNEAGSLMRCYELAVGDRFEVSKEAFTGSAIELNAEVTVVSKKLNIA